MPAGIGNNPFYVNEFESVNAGAITITDLMSGLSADTLALVTDAGVDEQAQGGVVAPGLALIGGTTAGSNFLLDSANNDVDRLAVYMADEGTVITGDDPVQNVVYHDQNGFGGGNGFEVAFVQQQAEQGLLRSAATAGNIPVSTGLGLIRANQLSITAGGDVTVYDVIPAGGPTSTSYVGHVPAVPGVPVLVLGNLVNLLAIDASTPSPETGGVNEVFFSAANGLGVGDIGPNGTNLRGGVAGILTNGGNITLEGNDIQIYTVDRATGDDINIDTTGDGIAPDGARVVLRPSTGFNGFVDRPGARAPIEILLGGANPPVVPPVENVATLALDGILDLAEVEIGAAGVRASVLEIGSRSNPATYAGKISVADNFDTFSSLLQVLHLLAGGAIEDIRATTGDLLTGLTVNSLAAEANGSISLIGFQNSIGTFAAESNFGQSEVRLVNERAGGLVLGTVDGISGILSSTFAAELTLGGLTQSPGSSIEAGLLSINTSAGNGDVTLNSENGVAQVAINAGTGNILLRTTGSTRIVTAAASQPGGLPSSVSGLTGDFITLYSGGDVSQDANAPITKGGPDTPTAVTVVTQNGFSITLDATSNRLPANSVFAAVTSSAALGNLTNLTLVNGTAGGGLELGSGAVINLNLTSAGSGYTGTPVPLTATISAPAGVGGTTATGQVVAGVKTVGVTSAGAGYLSAPTVTISGTGGAAAVGAVILNNALNNFRGSVSAAGTRVIIRDNTALILGTVTASTSLAATSTSEGITQTGVISSTGAASFAAANGFSIDVGTQANTFSGTVSFAALSGTLADVSVRDTTALVLGAITLTGNLGVDAPGITQSGALVVPGTITLVGGAANNITLSTAANNFGTVVITSGNNVKLTDANSIILAASGTVSGNLNLNSGISSQTGPITVVGTTTVSAGANAIVLNDANNNFGTSVNLSNTGLNNISVRDVGALVIGNISMSSGLGGGLTIQAGGDITQLTGTTITTGIGAIAITGVNGSSVALANAGNSFNGTVTLAPSVGVGNRLQNVTLLDTTTFDVQSGLNLAGNFVLTAAGVTQAGAITVVGSTTVSAGGNAIDLSNLGNNFGTSVNLSNTGANNISVRDTGALVIGNISMSSGLGGGLTIQAGGDITQLTGTTITTGTGLIAITGVNGSSVALANSGNAFNGTVMLAPSGAGVNRLQDISLTSTSAFLVQNGLALNGNLNLTASGITQAGAITVVGTTTLNGGTGAIVLTNSGNSYGGTVTVTGGASADMFFSLADEGDLGAVTTSGSFTLRTATGISLNIANGASAGFDVTDTQLSNFNVGTFAPIASGGGNLNLGALTSYPGIGSISLTTVGGGNINGLGAISMNTLQLNSSGAATFSAVNQIKNLGNVTVASGGLTFRNGRGLNLTGTATMPTGRLSLEVAGQFYNQTGQSEPLAGVAGGSVIKSLSLFGGLPNQVSGLAGFSYRYDGVIPNSGNVMSYAVSPLAMFAPGGTMIAGVDLGGTQTGGGQFNTFLTGSDNLNWMISDFGRFDMPTVKPSGMDYILYPQRVEPETRTLPAATLGQLERELGRPPTLDEIQAKEVAVREAAIVRSGAILERTSFDAVEDEVEKQESAEVPVEVIDGAKPQAGGPSVAPNPLSGGAMEGFGPQADAREQRSEDGVQKAEIGKRESAGVGPQARKTQSVKQGANGPILRSGPMRSVAELRPAEPAEGASAGKTATQAVHLDVKSVIEQERASAEVGIAPPIAAGR